MSRTVIDHSALHLLGSLVASRITVQDVPTDSWRPVVDLAVECGLAPVLLWTVRQSSFDTSGSQIFLPLVQTAHQTAMGAALLERAQCDVESALRDAGIPTLWIKGAALVHTNYPQPTLRPMSDLDVLVPYAQREQALSVVQRIGYDFYILDSRLSRSSGDALVLKLSHHYHLKGGVGNNVVLELHFRLLTYNDELLSLEQLQWFWGHRHTVCSGSDLVFDTLTPEAHLLYLCAHAMLQHGEGHPYLLRFFDMHQIVTQTPLDWSIIVDQAVVLGWTRAVERALQLCAEYFGTSVPEVVCADLVSRRPAHEDVSRVARLTGAGNRWERVRENMDDLSRRDRLVYILRIVFPNPAYIRQRYSVRPGWPTWPYYAYRWFDQGRDVVCSAWKRHTGHYRSL